MTEHKKGIFLLYISGLFLVNSTLINQADTIQGLWCFIGYCKLFLYTNLELRYFMYIFILGMKFSDDEICELKNGPGFVYKGSQVTYFLISITIHS